MNGCDLNSHDDPKDGDCAAPGEEEEICGVGNSVGVVSNDVCEIVFSVIPSCIEGSETCGSRICVGCVGNWD